MLTVAWVAMLFLYVSQWVITPVIFIEWETESETNSVGFNVYRQSANHDTRLRINPTLIPSQGNSQQGAMYEYADQSVQRGKRYVYFLEEIELDGTAVLHTQFHQTANIPYFPSWLILPIVVLTILTGWHIWTKKRDQSISGNFQWRDP